MKKIRVGLYEYKGYSIERLDHAAERWAGDDYYNLWRVTDTRGWKWETWLRHFETLKAAIQAIEEEQND